MQDQGKRLLLAVALALGVMMIWQVLFPPAKPKPKPVAQGSGQVVAPTVQGSPVGQALPTGSGSAATPVGSGSAATPVGSGSAATPVGSGSAATPVGSGSAVAEAPAGAPVVLEGYGVRVRFASTFALARVAGGKPDQITISHSDDGKVARTLTIVPVAVKGDKVEAIRMITKPGPGYQVGTTGTQVLLGPDMHDTQGIGVIESGPASNGWSIGTADKLEPWPGDTLCTDAVAAPGYTCHAPDPNVVEIGGPRAPPPAPAPAVNAPVAIVPCSGATQTFDFPTVKIATSACGGAITSWKLAARKYERERRKGELISPKGKGALIVNFAASTVVIPPETAWTPSDITDHSITYTWDSPELTVAKTFTFVPENFLVSTKITVTGKAGLARQTLALTSYAYQDPKEDTKHARGNIEWKAACLRGDVRVASWKQLAEQPRMENGVTWAGFAEGYIPGTRFSAAQAGQFLTASAPKPAGGQDLVACNAYAVPGTDGLMQVDLIFPTADLKAGDPPVIREVATYFGPTSYEVLEAADGKVGFSTGFKEVPDFGWFGVIGRPLLWLLHKLYGVFGNWGLAIVFLTLLVKGSTLYFTTRSMRSMKAMAALAPKMKELQEKYKDDRAKLQQETMAMYKQYGVNPLAGCLPILLQMPIWIALYRMLSSAGELYLEPLIPGWISDLTSPDPYHILPVVLITTMFAQAKLQPQTTTGFQQKLLMYGLPLMFGVASFFFPSGLSLYIVTNTLISALHSIYMNKFDKKGPAMVASINKRAAGGDGGKGEAKGGKVRDDRGSGKPSRDAKSTIEVEDRSTARAAAPPADPDPDADDESGDDPDDADDGAEAPAEGEGPAAAVATGPTSARRSSRARRKRRGRN